MSVDSLLGPGQRDSAIAWLEFHRLCLLRDDLLLLLFFLSLLVLAAPHHFLESRKAQSYEEREVYIHPSEDMEQEHKALIGNALPKKKQKKKFFLKKGKKDKKKKKAVQGCLELEVHLASRKRQPAKKTERWTSGEERKFQG